MQPGAPWTLFTDVTADSGLAAARLHASLSPQRDWIFESIGGGLAAADFDDDGDIDLFLTDTAAFDAAGAVRVPEAGARCRLFRNDGGLRFTDVTDASGAGLRGFFTGAAAADLDGDGLADLCVVGYGERRLLRNRGGLSFEDVTVPSGLAAAPDEPCASCSWGDVDGDGRLDLFVAAYVDQRSVAVAMREKGTRGPRHCTWRDLPVFCGPRGVPPAPNRLFLQQADGTFEDVSARLAGPARPSLQGVFSDLDGDGDLDLYVANDAAENELWINDGSGRFEDVAAAAGVAADRNAVAQGSMGVAVADVDQDGRMDLAVTNFVYETDALWLNRTLPGGGARFDDAALSTRFANARQDRLSWGIGLTDFDGDGFLDAFVASGHVYPQEEAGAPGGTPFRQRCRALRGLGPPWFAWEDVSARAGPPLADARCWRSAVFPDLDGDGDPDVVLTAHDSAPVVLRNDGGERSAWLRIALRPRTGLGTPAGARVTATLADGTTRTAEVHCGSSYASSGDPGIRIGAGAAASVAVVEVRWPDGTRTRLADVPTGRVVVVEQR